MTLDYATYIAGLPKILAGAAVLDGETPREAARRETPEQLASIVLQEEELDSWRLVPLAELDAYGPPWLVRRVTAALAALEAGTGPAELVNGQRPV